MGNQPSAPEYPRPQLRNFLRSTGTLGLSKSELDERCKSSGLYPSCPWDDKAIRRLIGDGKLAPRRIGLERRTTVQDQECPICFLQYSDINTTKCCQAYICTECYLQVRHPKEKAPACPFCNGNKFQVEIATPLDENVLKLRDEEEQKIMDATSRARSNTNGSEGSFGASLEQNERVALMRKRSESISEEGETVNISFIAMSPEERRALEEEMQAQTNNPLYLRVANEEAERRLRNEQDYYRTRSARVRELQAHRDGLNTRFSRGSTPRSGRDWNRIVEAFESSGNGSVQTLDDLVVLEAAIMLSMEENVQQHGRNVDFDILQHARQGFPLARARVGAGDDQLNHHVDSLLQSLRSNSDSEQEQPQRSDSLDAHELILRGYSEEEQLAMAIAASLQHQPSSNDATHEQSNSEQPELVVAPALVCDESDEMPSQACHEESAENAITSAAQVGSVDHPLMSTSNPASSTDASGFSAHDAHTKEDSQQSPLVVNDDNTARDWGDDSGEPLSLKQNSHPSIDDNIDKTFSGPSGSTLSDEYEQCSA